MEEVLTGAQCDPLEAAICLWHTQNCCSANKVQGHLPNTSLHMNAADMLPLSSQCYAIN